MRTCLNLTVLLLFGVFSLSAQYYYIPANINPNGNPGSLNTDLEEPYGDGLAPGWTNIDPMDNSPAWSAVQNIPFTFQFNAQPVTQYKVSNTGILTFTTTATSVVGTSNDILPDINIPDKSVCIWGITYSGGMCNDRIVTKTFGTAPHRQHWIQFNTYSFPAQHTQWTYLYISIVLEETSNNIYVVDQRCNDKGAQPTLTVGIQINSTTALMVAGSPNLGSVAGTSKTVWDNKHYSFIHGTPPQRDVGISWLQLSNFLILNAAPFDVKGTVKNYTGNMVNDYDINYSVNNGPPATCHMSGVAFKIPGYGEEWFIHDSMWTPPDTGLYVLKFWANNINGGPDENNSNDTAYKIIEVSHAFTPKLRLFEEFTSSTCETCKDANINLKTVLDRYPGDFAIIKYPMNYPDAGDPYYTTECGTRKTFYDVDSLPDMYVHGNVVVDPLYFDTIQYMELWDKSFMMINNPYHIISGNTITVSTTVLPFQTFSQGTLVLRYAVVEKTTTNNVGTNGETIFYHTFKKFIPDANGINLGILQQGVFTLPITRTYTFPTPNTIENWNNLAVVAFVQDNTTKQVYQAAYSTQMSGMDDPGAGQPVLRISPNPAEENTSLAYLINSPGKVVIELYNVNGQIIRSIIHPEVLQGEHHESLDLSGLHCGLYLVRLQTPTGTDLQKLIIQK